MSIEILDSCGFQLDTPYSEQPAKNYYSLEEITIINSCSKNACTFIEKSGNVPIETVHELQNLYFKLINKELDITVPAFNYQLSSGI